MFSVELTRLIAMAKAYSSRKGCIAVWVLQCQGAVLSVFWGAGRNASP